MPGRTFKSGLPESHPEIQDDFLHFCAMGSNVPKFWWANILLYGFSLGLLLTALRYSQFRILSIGTDEKWYVGLVAILFAVLGIWAGRKLKGKKNIPQLPGAEPFRPKTEVMEKLGITPRELEVLVAISKGLSNQEVADELFVSLNTVKTHTSNVFSKLGVQRRTQAIQQAKELGLLA